MIQEKFLHKGHLYEVLLDDEPPWKGMVHLVDAEMLHDGIQNTDVLITGATWNGQEIILGDAYSRVPAPDDLLRAASEVLRRRSESKEAIHRGAN